VVSVTAHHPLIAAHERVAIGAVVGQPVGGKEGYDGPVPEMEEGRRHKPILVLMGQYLKKV
jgi:hypothetical protein